MSIEPIPLTEFLSTRLASPSHFGIVISVHDEWENPFVTIAETTDPDDLVRITQNALNKQFEDFDKDEIVCTFEKDLNCFIAYRKSENYSTQLSITFIGTLSQKCIDALQNISVQSKCNE